MQRPYRYRPALFFLLAYAVSWSLWLYGVSLGSQEGGSLFSLIGLFGPVGAALFLVFTSGSTALKSDFKDRLFNLARIRPVYAIGAAVLPFAVICLSILLSLAFGQSANQFQLSGGGGLFAMVALAMVTAPIMEETGWHGYGVDSLRAEAGMMKATLLFAWHAPLVLIPGTYQNQVARMDNSLFVANFFVSIIPAAIIANWFYYKNGRSIALAIFLHAMLNAGSVLINAGQVAKCIATVLYAAIAVALIVARNFLPESPH